MPNKVQPESTGAWGDRAFTHAAPHLRPHEGPGGKRPAAARKALPRQSRDRREISRAVLERGGCAWGGFSPALRRAAPGRLRALSGQRGTGRRVLAWRRVAAAVGRVGGRAKAALTGAWEPPTRRRLLGRCSLRSPRASPAAPRGAGVLEAAQRMGGREWPRPLLLCIIVTQAISCLEVWEKEKKKSRVGAGGSGRR